MAGFFSGWGSSGDGLRERFATLPERYTQYDLVLAWETKSLGARTVIDGVVKNVRYAYLDGLPPYSIGGTKRLPFSVL
jgi:hypothetical protein